MTDYPTPNTAQGSDRTAGRARALLLALLVATAIPAAIGMTMATSGGAEAATGKAAARALLKRVQPAPRAARSVPGPAPAAGRVAQQQAERAAMLRSHQALDRTLLARIESRYGTWIDARRLDEARRRPGRILEPDEYMAHLRRSFPQARPQELQGILGDYTKGRISVNRASQTVPLTLAHERLHQLSHPAFARGAGGRIDEGVTEILARRISPDPALRDLGKVYPREQGIAHRLFARAGDDVMGRAYFGGDLAGLRRSIDRDLGPGAFDRAVRAMQSGQSDRAARILGGLP